MKSKQQQIQIIRYLLLPNTEYKADEIDLKAEVDSTCSLEENWDAIKRNYAITTLEEFKSEMERYKDDSKIKV